MAILILVPVIIGLIILVRHIYIIKPDTCTVFTGGLGSGKSLVSVQIAKQLLRKNRRKVFFYNLFHRKEKRPRPLLYSTIPVRISKKEWSQPITDTVPILQQKIVLRSVVFFDEVSLYIDQMRTKFNNADALEEWCTLFRHYTQGGYLVMNTQNSSKVNFHIRYCLNRAYNLFEWRHIWRFYWVKIRDVSLAEDIKSIFTGQLEDEYKVKFGFLPFRREYDTYVYSGRVANLPEPPLAKRHHYKTNVLTRIPGKAYDINLVETDEEEQGRAPAETPPAPPVPTENVEKAEKGLTTSAGHAILCDTITK